MAFDATTEIVNHFIGIFATVVEELRMRQVYDEFKALKKLDAEFGKLLNVKVTIDSPYSTGDFSTSFNGLQFKALAVEPARFWVENASELPDIYISTGLSKFVRQSDGEIRIPPPGPEFDLQPASSLLAVTVQLNTLSDNDIYGDIFDEEGALTFVAPKDFDTQTEGMMILAGSLTGFSAAIIGPAHGGIAGYASYVAELLDAVADPGIEGASVTILRGADALGKHENGGHVEELTELDDVRPAYFESEETEGPEHADPGETEQQEKADPGETAAIVADNSSDGGGAHDGDPHLAHAAVAATVEEVSAAAAPEAQPDADAAAGGAAERVKTLDISDGEGLTVIAGIETIAELIEAPVTGVSAAVAHVEELAVAAEAVADAGLIEPADAEKIIDVLGDAGAADTANGAFVAGDEEVARQQDSAGAADAGYEDEAAADAAGSDGNDEGTGDQGADEQAADDQDDDDDDGENGDDDGGDDDESEGGFWDVEDGHAVVAGANQQLNEVAIHSAWLDAPVIAVMGDVAVIDAISQVNVLFEASIGSAEAVLSQSYNSAAIIETATTVVSPDADDDDGDNDGPGRPDLPDHWVVTRVDGDLVQVNWIEQFNFATDQDMARVEFSGDDTLVQLGNNSLINLADMLEIGFGYDLIMVGGTMVSVNLISQVNALLDIDSLSYDGAGPDSLSMSDNLLFNSAVIDASGVDNWIEMDVKFANAGHALAAGAQNIGASVAKNEMFDGIDVLRVLYIEGDWLTINSITQTNILGDADQVHLALEDFVNKSGGEVTITTGSNSLVNLAEVVDYGVDSTVMVGGEVYSEALIYQAELIDTDADPSGVALMALASEAVAFLAPDIIEDTLPEDVYTSSTIVTDSSSADILQTMLA
ncbi:hypothetical protein [Candidatus Halocynthiibacter alkanivorans]|uniref:hypothetical protein n=1 Tax=Candidatus Halocynthiibacter alkanivorans TaxID=2267619 RepID=UPI000DF4B0AB|nr:hypothetical protein [Candidatus Halocynthiibacter alkanivorans]